MGARAEITANPLLGEDAARREAARSAARLVYQRSCRPCHGMLGAGDGPYAHAFGAAATDLLSAAGKPGATARMFERIKRGAGALSEAEQAATAMPGFGDVLSDREIWAVLLVLDEARALVAGGAASTEGAALYGGRCAVCHGTEGAGDGALAREIYPRPRDLRRASYRFRSTASGAPPRTADVIRTLERGLDDTAMGSVAPLGDRALARLVQRLKTFAPERFTAHDPPALPAPPEIAVDAALVARGRTLYGDLSCWQCHGKDGRGDGPSAADLRDDTGNVSRPSNLTKRWQLKGGASAQDIFRTITTGLNGTPMPSYAEAVEAEDRWALASFVESLGRPRPAAVRMLRAVSVRDTLPRDPAVPLWSGLERTMIPLGPQMLVEPRWAAPAVDAVAVAVALSDREVGFLMVWDDRSRDVTNEDVSAARDASIDAQRVGHWRLADQIAVQFPSGEGSAALPSLEAGDAARPIVRWTWSAERAARGGAAGVEMVRLAGADAPAAAIERSPVDQESAPRRWLPIPGLGKKGPVPGEEGGVAVISAASFVDGQWRVLVIAERNPAPASFPRFVAGGRVSFALQVWDGGSGESARRHALSSWITLVLPDESPGATGAAGSPPSR